ncbi:replication protein A 70 kDa DNA-binding subunit C-like isoform X2 [Raphanus sativus]|uniref:Replication protein A 70 kDa DNA-binding subunit C-like isoform X2 n=1 Tax=Raphanus sativus TaxID=3726 RepID=A0A9W3DTN9_RAPSA|nr:replication protein A 70 kDa DNA-binding subunit C-like isoform X2 [Raphanus sativus]
MAGPTSSSDVIGQAIDIGDMQVVPVQSRETKKLEFTLTDTDDHQIACCLWGRFAEHVYYAYKVGQLNKNFLCLLRFAKINVYKGQVQITNAFETSTLEINPPGFDVQDYQRVMPNNDLALTSVNREVVKPKGNQRQADKWSLYPERTVLDIIMATEIEKCIVKATIYAIDTDWAWYYFGCVKCHFKKVTNITKKDVVPVNHLWYCDSCKQSVTDVAPKLKLHLLIKDDTGETKVMLFDTIAEPIVGLSAEVLLDGSLEEVEDPEDLPEPINGLIGKTFKFGVYVGKENVDYGSHIFTIGKTWSADEIISQSDDEKTEDTLTILSSDRSSGQVSYVTIESEDNTCLSSNPLSKRKGDNEVDDLSSTSKKQCSKIIKVEKNADE